MSTTKSRFVLCDVIALEFFPNLSEDEGDGEFIDYAPNPFYSFDAHNLNMKERAENAIAMIREALHDIAGTEDDYIVSVGCIESGMEGTIWHPMKIEKFKAILASQLHEKFNHTASHQ